MGEQTAVSSGGKGTSSIMLTTWTLVLYLQTAMPNSTMYMPVTGFSSEFACNEAAQKIKRGIDAKIVGTTYALHTCVEVK